jgi:hypothetical protein
VKSFATLSGTSLNHAPGGVAGGRRPQAATRALAAASADPGRLRQERSSSEHDAATQHFQIWCEQHEVCRFARYVNRPLYRDHQAEAPQAASKSV